ncbi:uncharacterized protein N7484_011007 [Penicillium longicatenatum]|uniref:uncharacterized protein n=1 Tax=Penicillium longicatenatum TaxID=1561947 RepID=UPI0025495AA2|nr:uncharacterized protein N7484_011007 [Penicillium longicatenatum]KAJ5630907.1 hypothetical protein N7484_011007 [Penicillium longicatenatum]
MLSDSPHHFAFPGPSPASFIAPFRPSAARRSDRGWRPIALRPPFLAGLACCILSMFMVLEGIRQYSNRQGGLVFFSDTDDVTSVQSFLYNYLPIIVSLLLLMVWTVTDFDVLRLEPYFQLSQPGGAPASVLFINYNFGQTILTPINAARRHHWVVLWVSLVTLSIRMVLPALTSTMFELRGVDVIQRAEMKSWPHLVDLESQASWMSTQANHSMDSVLSSDKKVPRTRSANYAIAPVEIPADSSEKDTMWTLDQMLYWSDLTCIDVPVDESLSSVTINETVSSSGFPTISWNATGTDSQDDYNSSSTCRLDFHYSSIFFSGTDYLQVRYWEPVIDQSAAAEYPNHTHAFTTTGCDPHDLYGMLISVNATGATSSEPEYAASGVAFACDISYHKAEARVQMHSNSSITSIHIHPATTRTVTEAEFNIAHFQALLSEHAPYTSDMLFIRENETTGAQTVTELPVISEEMGDLESLLMLDTAAIMTQAEFKARIRRDVKQTFVLTLGRLFDPDRKPTTIFATSSTNKVAIAIVNFAALWSELILGLAALTSIYLLFLYRSRQTFLQSDPGSIAAMCSIAADVLHPNNILADPSNDFHQFSTRQLNLIFRKARCYWRPTPSGNRLEILAEDGSPVQIGDDTRVLVDRMPHFLVVPFFIIEFGLLAAVIILMGLVIGSLARDGKFRHLTQSDSSSFQVVLSILPSVVASSVGSLCTSIHRNISVLEPWVHLQRGMATARASLATNYASQSPFAIFFKCVRNRNILLSLVSLACVVNMVLTVVAGGLFTQEMTTSNLTTTDLTMNYSQSTFLRSDFSAEFTEYDLIQTSIMSGVPMLSWTSSNQSFVPVHINHRDPEVMYGAETLGIGAAMECQALSPEEGLFHNKTTGLDYWQYSMFHNSSVECTAPMPSQNKDEGIALSIHFLSPDDANGGTVCQTSTVLVVGRWDYLANSDITDYNTIALHCEPRVRMQDYSIKFDEHGQIHTHIPVANTSITEGTMYDNATVSLGQFNKVFAAIPDSYVGNTTTINGTYNISSYDWAGFLVARLYQREDPDFDSLEPARLIDLTRHVYQWVYSTYFSIWRDIYLEPLQKPVAAINPIVIRSTWAMVPSIPSLAIALMIIGFDTLVVLLVFGTRRGRFRGPRMPRSIGAIVPWLAHSRMLNDFKTTHAWTNSKRREHLAALDRRYGFRMFLSPDGRWRFAVDEEPPQKLPDDPQDVQHLAFEPDPDADANGANKTTSIQLQELTNQQPRAREPPS